MGEPSGGIVQPLPVITTGMRPYAAATAPGEKSATMTLGFTASIKRAQVSMTGRSSAVSANPSCARISASDEGRTARGPGR